MITREFIFAALDAEKTGNAFPIDFEDVWEFSGYSRKDHAVRFFSTLTGLKENVHFSPKMGKSSQGGRPSVSFGLSVDTFKFFLAKSNTEQGDASLWALIEIEKAYRANLERQFAQPDTSDRLAELEALIANFQTQVPQLENTIVKLEATIVNLETKVIDLEGKLKFVKGARDNYFDQLQTFKAKRHVEVESKTGETEFPREFNAVYAQIPYHSKSYLFMDVMLKLLNLREGKDYVFVGNKTIGKKEAVNYKVIRMSEESYQAILQWGRPKRGVTATEATPRELTVKRGFLTNHHTSKGGSANTFQPKPD